MTLSEKRNRRYLETYGCSYKQMADMRAHCRALGRLGVTRERQPIGAFRRQRQNAKDRGIGWELKFWEWWTIWSESGKWNERGRGDGYVMSRNGDAGPYAKGNVFIQLARYNNSEKPWKKSGLPIGVFKRGHKYWARVMLEGKIRHFGSYDTPDKAEMAYLLALFTDKHKFA